MTGAVSATVGPLRRVLIANRGEIAIRIAKAADGLGIESVAIYPPADERSLHTRVTTIRHALAATADPIAAYLDVEAVVAAAVETGCDCVHPGYGFLAEHAGFAERCAAAGITFIGPRPETLALFGDKVAARALATQHRRAGARRQRRRGGDGRRCGRRRRRDRLPGDAQGGGGRRRARDARRDRPRGPGRSVRALPQRGDDGLRQRRRLRRAAAGPPPPHRGPDPRRRPRPRRAPLRPRLLGAAAQPEGRRGRSGAGARRPSCGRGSSATPSPSPRPPATSTPAPSSSSSPRRPASTRSSSATRASRSSTPSPSRSPASTSSRPSSASPAGRRSPTSGWPARTTSTSVATPCRPG